MYRDSADFMRKRNAMLTSLFTRNAAKRKSRREKLGIPSYVKSQDIAAYLSFQTQLRRAEAKMGIDYQALDPLTQLLNRGWYDRNAPGQDVGMTAPVQSAGLMGLPTGSPTYDPLSALTSVLTNPDIFPKVGAPRTDNDASATIIQATNMLQNGVNKGANALEQMPAMLMELINLLR